MVGPTPSIIVTPDGKRPRTLTLDMWRKVLRLMRDIKAEGWRVNFTCEVCRQPIAMVSPLKHAPELSCSCTTWVGR